MPPGNSKPQESSLNVEEEEFIVLLRLYYTLTKIPHSHIIPFPTLEKKKDSR